MASPTAADRLVEVLIAWNVDTIFGMPGDGINGFMEAPRKRRDEIRFIRVRHEEAAAFAAVGYAKFTGRLGICLATSGPDGIHLLISRSTRRSISPAPSPRAQAAAAGS